MGGFLVSFFVLCSIVVPFIFSSKGTNITLLLISVNENRGAETPVVGSDANC